MNNLLEQLQQVPDYRHIKGRRHQLWLVLFVILLGTMTGYWGIENRLHWVRDVTFKEDFPPRLGGNAPVNWSILHNFFITLARQLGFRTIPQAQRALSNQLELVFSLFV